jgi:hypothetical protein
LKDVAPAAAPAPAPKKEKKERGPTKVQRVIEMCSRKDGATLDHISSALSISKAAASSLIGDARRAGKNIKREVGENGVGVYKL